MVLIYQPPSADFVDIATQRIGSGDCEKDLCKAKDVQGLALRFHEPKVEPAGSLLDYLDTVDFTMTGHTFMNSQPHILLYTVRVCEFLIFKTIIWKRGKLLPVKSKYEIDKHCFHVLQPEHENKWCVTVCVLQFSSSIYSILVSK
jgi:hypothetical protein